MLKSVECFKLSEQDRCVYGGQANIKGQLPFTRFWTCHSQRSHG